MQIEVLLTPHVWLQAPTDIRVALVKEFEIPRTGVAQCVTFNGVTRIESDGHSINDLRRMNPQSMQVWLGFANPDPYADVNALFAMCAKRMEEKMHPKDEQEKEVSKEVSTQEKNKSPFCNFCDSKGYRHKKNCTKPYEEI